MLETPHPKPPTRAHVKSNSLADHFLCRHAVTVERYEEQLALLGLSTLEGIKRFEGTVIDLHHGKSDTSKFTIKDGDGQTRTLFLKRYWKVRRRSAIVSLFRHGRVWSAARDEWENLRRLQQAGVPTAPLVALAEECGPCSERFSSIITESAGELSLDHFIEQCRDRSQRKKVFAQLARSVRKMHEAGFASADLFCRHLFLDLSAGEPRFTLIDMARLNRRRRPSARLRARDLSSLNASAPLRFASPMERLRFLKAYDGRIDRRLIQLIGRRMKRLLRRPKFQHFGALAQTESTCVTP